MKIGTDALNVVVSPETGNWNLQRSDLRYEFIATIEVLDVDSGKQIVCATSNLSRYGCHVRTITPFLPGTSVKLTIKHQGITVESAGKVVYAISGEGMGVHFAKVGSGERLILKEWLVQVGAEELEERLRKSSNTKIALSKKEIVFLIGCLLGLAVLVAGAFSWLGIL